MIPVRYKNQHAVFEKLHAEIKDKCEKYDEIDGWCKANIIIKGKQYSFQEIIEAKYADLVKIKEFCDSSGVASSFIYKEYMLKKVYTLYLDRIELFNSLNISICPYCNRNYIKLPGGKHAFQLDHYYDKDDYPVLAVSFNNLIPVCYSCNHKKSTKEFSYSPHNSKYCSADELGHFEYWVTSCDYLVNSDSIEVEYLPEEIMKKNNDVLDISNIYSTHKKEVQKILKKATIFSDVLIKDLYLNYPKLFSDTSDVERLIYDVSAGKNDYSNESLSKFKSDVMRQLRSI